MWLKRKCLNRAGFVIVGWSEPEGSRTLLFAALLITIQPGRLLYAVRVGTGMSEKTLRMLHGFISVTTQIAGDLVEGGRASAAAREA
jgi:ATP-dependent DNA ligase